MLPPGACPEWFHSPYLKLSMTDITLRIFLINGAKPLRSTTPDASISVINGNALQWMTSIHPVCKPLRRTSQGLHTTHILDESLDTLTMQTLHECACVKTSHSISESKGTQLGGSWYEQTIIYYSDYWLLIISSICRLEICQLLIESDNICFSCPSQLCILI